MSERVDPVVVGRIAPDLSRWQRPAAARAELAPLVALDELEAWLNDAGRSDGGAVDDWASLLADVELSWGSLGRHTAAAMPRLQGVLQRVGAARSGLAARRGRGLDASTKAVLEAAMRDLRGETHGQGVVPGAIADVLVAGEHEQRLDALPPEEDVRWQLVILHGFAQLQGHDWGLAADRLQAALGTAPDADSGPVEDVIRVLDGPPDQGHSVVWVVIDHASAWGRSGLEPVVQLFDADWLIGNLEQTPQHELVERRVPAELAVDPEGALTAFRPRLNEQLPVVLARVDLGHGAVAGAAERALDTLELLRAYASFQQGGTNWRISGARLHFVDGRQVLGSYGPIGDPDVYDRLERGDVLADLTASTLKAHAAELAPHLPVRDGRTREALELTRWLSLAWQTWAPARLVLAGRIVEQCASWSQRTLRQLLEDLALPAVWQRLEARIACVGRAAVLRMPGHDGTRSSDAERENFLFLSRAILAAGDGRRLPIAKPREVVQQLPALLAAHGPDSDVKPALGALSALLSTGRDTCHELERLKGEVELLRRRAKRTRNSLAHGGPLLREVVASVVESQDRLAALTLQWVLDGRLAEVPLPAHVDALADGFRRRLDALARGGQPRDELFPGRLTSWTESADRASRTCLTWGHDPWAGAWFCSCGRAPR